jgi:PhnB protein
MIQINPYVNFSGNCREAMIFYNDCLQGELTLQTVEGSPIEAQCPGAMKDQILHSSLIKNGTLLLMGSDMVGPDGYLKGNSIALSLSCSSEEEINNFFKKLSAGGQIVHPLQAEFWGAIFGVVSDKFGIKWMLSYDRNQQN